MDSDQRKQQDRRIVPTGPWSAFPPAGLRMRARRADEHRQPYFVDRFSATTLALILMILVSCVADAVLTIHLLGSGAEEVNPLLKHLLQRGILHFLVGKYVLTVIGLPLLLIFKNFYLFGTRFRVGHSFPAIVVLYLILIAYQIALIFASAS
jgi:hypothetical protein